MAEVRMPKMGDGMEEGTITSWLKKEGDPIKEGDAIAEVETDKANVEIPAEESGVLAKIIVQVGQTVPVGEIIAQIGDGAQAGQPGNGARARGGEMAFPEKPAVRAASPPPESAEAGAPSGFPEQERIKASPLARRIARDLGIDLARLRGSGPGGRIVERDVHTFHAAAQERPPVAPPTIPMRPAPAQKPAGPGEEIVPTKMREAIARRTVLSKQSIPHFYVTMRIEMDRALSLLKEMNADASEGKITVNELIVKASAVALGRVPEANATWTPDGTVYRYSEVHIGIAVGIEEGLIIPVVKDCHTKTLRRISADAKVLIGKARANQLRPDDYSGGTFSVSNLGMMGVDEFIAIINPPEAAILAIGGILREPVVTTGDEIAIRSIMKITLSSDHRLLDGVTAARFLQEVKKLLEAPHSLLA